MSNDPLPVLEQIGRLLRYNVVEAPGGALQHPENVNLQVPCAPAEAAANGMIMLPMEPAAE